MGDPPIASSFYETLLRISIEMVAFSVLFSVETPAVSIEGKLMKSDRRTAGGVCQTEQAQLRGITWDMECIRFCIRNAGLCIKHEVCIKTDEFRKVPEATRASTTTRPLSSSSGEFLN